MITPERLPERPSKSYYLDRDALASRHKTTQSLPRPQPTLPPVPNSTRTPANHRFSRKFIGSIVALTILIAATVVVVLLMRPSHSTTTQTSGLPASILSEISGLNVYYPVHTTTDFRLVDSSLSYQSGVLLFSLADPKGNTLVFTEETTPPGYDISALQADKQFNTEYGQAFITDALSRTTGALFTASKTFILVNAPNPVGSEVMESILNELSPVKSS